MPQQIPTLTTRRLILRPFRLEDAKEVQRLAGAYEIARTTLNIPHPSKDGMAESWIQTHQQEFEKGENVVFAITHREQNYLIGATGLSSIKKEFDTAELGYWIGVPYWNNGYGTEAAAAIIKFGFTDLNLNRIYAHHFKQNPSSGRIMQKVGMTHEGSLRQHVKKWDRYIDIEVYGILKEDVTDSLI